MRRLRSSQVLCSVIGAILFLGSCGGNKPPAPSPFPAKITLTPATSASLQEGSALRFIASALNGAGTAITPDFVFTSDNPSVLTLSPAGVACGGTWNAPAYSVCTPGRDGVANVTASALGATSPPTVVFVHRPIDNIQISVVPPVNPPPPACPTQVALPQACLIAFNANPYCLSQNQAETLQATALSQGTDITSTVGPFTWTEEATSVVTVKPTIDLTTDLATNQATATPDTPGETQVFASASGVSSQPFAFETCPIQCIALQVGQTLTEPPPTSFAVSKGTAQTITATAVDVQGCAVTKPPLTWTSSQPASVAPGSSTTGCAAGSTCSATTPEAGGASITASCTPPSCNVGFPLNPLGLPAPFAPQPVYPVTAISGLVSLASSTPATFNVLATSFDCATNANCSVSMYDISTTKNVSGDAIPTPTPPNSLIFAPGGTKAYMGGQYGAMLVTPASFGSANSPFKALPASATPTGEVTGKALAVSPNGDMAIFSDTVSSLNQVYVVNTTSSTPVATALNISGATAAAFSPDGMKAFIIACPCSTSTSTLYIYSTLQALQSIPLSFAADNIAFSSSGTFALLTGGSSSSASAIGINTCDNSVSAPSPGNPALSLSSLPAEPIFLKMVPSANVPTGSLIPNLNPDGLDFFFGIDSTGLDIIATNSALPGSPNNLFKTLCPQTVGLVPTFAPIHIPFGQGSFDPIAFFLSPDNTQVYVVASDRSAILVYSFNTGSVSAIPLTNSITGETVFPVAADITADGTLIYVAASDGTLHQISTASGASTDLSQIGFSPVRNGTNGFCVSSVSPINCSVDLVAIKP